MPFRCATLRVAITRGVRSHESRCGKHDAERRATKAWAGSGALNPTSKINSGILNHSAWGKPCAPPLNANRPVSESMKSSLVPSGIEIWPTGVGPENSRPCIASSWLIGPPNPNVSMYRCQVDWERRQFLKTSKTTSWDRPCTKSYLHFPATEAELPLRR